MFTDKRARFFESIGSVVYQATSAGGLVDLLNASSHNRGLVDYAAWNISSSDTPPLAYTQFGVAIASDERSFVFGRETRLNTFLVSFSQRLAVSEQQSLYGDWYLSRFGGSVFDVVASAMHRVYYSSLMGKRLRLVSRLDGEFLVDPYIYRQIDLFDNETAVFDPDVDYNRYIIDRTFRLCHASDNVIALFDSVVGGYSPPGPMIDAIIDEGIYVYHKHHEQNRSVSEFVSKYFEVR